MGSIYRRRSRQRLPNAQGLTLILGTAVFGSVDGTACSFCASLTLKVTRTYWHTDLRGNGWWKARTKQQWLRAYGGSHDSRKLRKIFRKVACTVTGTTKKAGGGGNSWRTEFVGKDCIWQQSAKLGSPCLQVCTRSTRALKTTARESWSCLDWVR